MMECSPDMIFGLTVGVLAMRKIIIMSIMNTKNVIMNMLNQLLLVQKCVNQNIDNLLSELDLTNTYQMNGSAKKLII
jgi:NAD-dependent SIR2 family protein deacetylase